ncbi:MAG: type III pantothenate kinase [Alphaproteobacteria bacterium]|jgi:type III pantothenate kinase
MLLAIDCGNTNTIFAIYDNNRWVARWRMATSAVRTADQYIVWLSALMSLENINIKNVTGCIISTVVPQSLFHLRNLCKRHFNQTPLIIGHNVTPNIAVKIDNPDEAGADRLVNAVAAHKKYKGSLLVIDSGTATTFDVIASDGAFLGGVICPGLSLSVLALHNAAAKLPRVEIKETEKVIGKNTVQAMQSGIFWGYIGLIEGLVTRIRGEYVGNDCNDTLTVIATGGIVSLFEGATDFVDYFDSDLTLDGLLEIYTQYNNNLKD